LAGGVTDAGDRLPVIVALVGETAKVSATAELKLLNDVTVIVEVPPFPAMAVAVVGDALIVKSFTVNANGVV